MSKHPEGLGKIQLEMYLYWTLSEPTIALCNLYHLDQESTPQAEWK